MTRIGTQREFGLGRRSPTFGRALFWGTPILAASIFVSVMVIAGPLPFGSQRNVLVLWSNAILSFLGSGAGAFLIPRTVPARVAAGLCGGSFGAAAYVMLTLIADQIVPGI